MLLGMVHPDAGRADAFRRRYLPAAAGDPRADRLSGRRPSAVPLDDGGRGGAVHPALLHATGTSSFWTRHPRPFPRFRRGHKIGRLSNGQRAQVSLALALAPDPELLILDDPTLGLDTVVRRDFSNR